MGANSCGWQPTHDKVSLEILESVALCSFVHLIFLLESESISISFVLCSAACNFIKVWELPGTSEANSSTIRHLGDLQLFKGTDRLATQLLLLGFFLLYLLW